MSNNDEQKSFYERRLWALYQNSKRLANPEKFATDVNQKLAQKPFLKNIVARRFASAGASGGQSWSPLKDATIKQRLRMGFGAGPILVRTGALINSCIQGTQTGTLTGITLTTKDVPAPTYRGRKSGGNISAYIYALHKRRPFLQQPSDAELAELRKERDRLVGEIIATINSGHGVGSLLK